MFKNRNGIFALRNIKKGEELTIVYDVNGGGDKNEYAPKCLCGSENCRGYL